MENQEKQYPRETVIHTEEEDYILGHIKGCDFGTISPIQWAVWFLTHEPEKKSRRGPRPWKYSRENDWAVRVAVKVLRHSAIDERVIASVTSRLERSTSKAWPRRSASQMEAEIIPFPSLAERARGLS